MDPKTIENAIRQGMQETKRLYDRYVTFTRVKLLLLSWGKYIFTAIATTYMDSRFGGLSKLLLTAEEIKAIASTDAELVSLDFYSGAVFWALLIAAGFWFKTGVEASVSARSLTDDRSIPSRHRDMFFTKVLIAAVCFLSGILFSYPFVSRLGTAGYITAGITLLFDGAVLLTREHIRELLYISNALGTISDSFEVTPSVMEEVRRDKGHKERIGDTTFFFEIRKAGEEKDLVRTEILV